MKNTLINRYVRLNVAERRGVFALLFLSLVFWVGSAAIRQYEQKPKADVAELAEKSKLFFAQAKPMDTPEAGIAPSVQLVAFDPNTASIEDLQAVGMPKWLAERIDKYRSKGGQFRKPADLGKIYGMPPELFAQLEPFVQIETDEAGAEKATASFAKNSSKTEAPTAVLSDFDPNTCTEADFVRLGLKPYQAKSILNYRAKGGQFRKPDDFAKIYGLSPEQFSTLKPYIKIITDVTPVAYSTKPEKQNNQLAANSKPVSSIDINAATAAEWNQLPGIGDFYAEKIVKLREKLGGFANVQMVSETRGLPDSTFQKIKPFLKYSGGLQKIPINQVDEKTLAVHPLFDGKQSKILVNYRTHHGAYQSTADIAEALPLINKEWLKRIEPYLQF
jgi:competence ComEA-like helix-hairpin-helix protein